MSSHAGAAATLTVDGQTLPVQPGDTLAACLLRGGVFATRHSLTGQPRGLYCGMGVCNDCLLTVDGARNVRACVTLARPGAIVLTGNPKP